MRTRHRQNVRQPRGLEVIFRTRPHQTAPVANDDACGQTSAGLRNAVYQDAKPCSIGTEKSRYGRAPPSRLNVEHIQAGEGAHGVELPRRLGRKILEPPESAAHSPSHADIERFFSSRPHRLGRGARERTRTQSHRLACTTVRAEPSVFARIDHEGTAAHVRCYCPRLKHSSPAHGSTDKSDRESPERAYDPRVTSSGEPGPYRTRPERRDPCPRRVPTPRACLGYANAEPCASCEPERRRQCRTGRMRRAAGRVAGA